MVFPAESNAGEGGHAHPSRRPRCSACARRSATRARCARAGGCWPSCADRCGAGAGRARQRPTLFEARDEGRAVLRAASTWRRSAAAACAGRTRDAASKLPAAEPSDGPLEHAARAARGHAAGRGAVAVGRPGDRARALAALPGAASSAPSWRPPTPSGSAWSTGDDVRGQPDGDERARRGRAAPGGPRRAACSSPPGTAEQTPRR